MMSVASATACPANPPSSVTRTGLWANFAGYQTVWFCAVIGAAHELAWPGALACLAFAAWQLAASSRRRLQGCLIAIALCCGLILDGSLSLGGWIDYAAPAASVPVGGAPLWNLALWASFALTVPRSLRYLQKRLWVAGLFGAVGGPLAYWCAARAWNVLMFDVPQWHALGALALGWGLAMPLLAGVARHAGSKSTQSGDRR